MLGTSRWALNPTGSLMRVRNEKTWGGGDNGKMETEIDIIATSQGMPSSTGSPQKLGEGCGVNSHAELKPEKTPEFRLPVTTKPNKQ